MKSLLKWGAAGAVVSSLSGVGLHGAWDYVQVGRNRVAKAVQDQIPLPVEIERLQVLVGRLDEQLGKHQRVVAEAAVELERAERDVARDRDSVHRTREKMVSLRDMTKGEGCAASTAARQYSRTEIAAALRGHLERYKTSQRSLEVREAALNRQRSSYEKLSRKLADWKAERDTLGQTLITLRTELESLRVSDSPAVVFDDSELRSARDLADRIKQKLDVEEKLRDLQSDPADLLDSASDRPGSDVLREVDDLLGASPAST